MRSNFFPLTSENKCFFLRVIREESIEHRVNCTVTMLLGTQTHTHFAANCEIPRCYETDEEKKTKKKKKRREKSGMGHT